MISWFGGASQESINNNLNMPAAAFRSRAILSTRLMPGAALRFAALRFNGSLLLGTPYSLVRPAITRSTARFPSVPNLLDATKALTTLEKVASEPVYEL